MDSPVPQRRKRKPGQKVNRPVTVQQRDNAEKDLDTETLKTVQSQSESLSYRTDLNTNGQNKPNWSECSDKSPDIKFWLARWELLEVRNDVVFEMVLLRDRHKMETLYLCSIC